MTYQVVEVLYVCPKHMEPSEKPGPCPICGRERVMCQPGEADDPCRKPLISPTGEIRSRAPLWWLVRRVAWIAELRETSNG